MLFRSTECLVLRRAYVLITRDVCAAMILGLLEYDAGSGSRWVSRSLAGWERKLFDAFERKKIARSLEALLAAGLIEKAGRRGRSPRWSLRADALADALARQLGEAPADLWKTPPQPVENSAEPIPKGIPAHPKMDIRPSQKGSRQECSSEEEKESEGVDEFARRCLSFFHGPRTDSETLDELRRIAATMSDRDRSRALKGMAAAAESTDWAFARSHGLETPTATDFLRRRLWTRKYSRNDC